MTSLQARIKGFDCDSMWCSTRRRRAPTFLGAMVSLMLMLPNAAGALTIGTHSHVARARSAISPRLPEPVATTLVNYDDADWSSPAIVGSGRRRVAAPPAPMADRAALVALKTLMKRMWRSMLSMLVAGAASRSW